MKRSSLLSALLFLVIAGNAPARMMDQAQPQTISRQSGGVMLAQTGYPIIDEEKSLSDDVIEIPPEEIPKLRKDPADEEEEPGPDPAAGDDSGKDAPPPEIQRDLSKLPKPVARMRELILQAAKSGDIEKLRPLIGIGETKTTLSLAPNEDDPIKLLKDASGDSEGHEILAILIEVLNAGYVHLDSGQENELYVWPYFFAWPIEKLTPEMKVELFQLVTAGDYEDMTSFGGYIFYRIGITPDGEWSFFVAGD